MVLLPQVLWSMFWIWPTDSSPKLDLLLQLASWWAPSTGPLWRTERSLWCRYNHRSVFSSEKLKVQSRLRFCLHLCSWSMSGTSEIKVGTVWSCLVRFSFLTIPSAVQVVGHKEGLDVMERADPLFLLIGLPTIPVMLILGKMIRWEDYVLRLWRKYSNKLQILNSIFPGTKCSFNFILSCQNALLHGY